MTAASRALRVLVVDDSAVARQTIALALSRDGMEVATVPDPIIALERVRTGPPDVLVLDLEMPRMDGLTLLGRLMRQSPLPVVVCSASTGPGSSAAVEALSRGAVAVVEKRSLGVAGAPELAQLTDAVRAAGAAAVRRASQPRRPLAASGVTAPRLTPSPDAVIAVGASTGGTCAIESLLRALPYGAPPILVVQHMPAGFTRALAERLDRETPHSVREAVGGERLEPGLVLIAPGDRHLLLHRVQGALVARLGDTLPVCRHCPSVDVLFRSVADVAGGSRATGVLLTGMGEDGAEGMLALRRTGAWTVAQDEATSVVFGMPAEAIRRGGVDEVLPLPRIAPALAARAGRIARQASSSPMRGL